MHGSPLTLINGCYGQGWGKTVIIGVEMHGSPLTLSPYDILKGKTITGSLFGGLKPKSDIPLLAQKYLDNVSALSLSIQSLYNNNVMIGYGHMFMSQELNLDGFITQEVDFKDINKAFDYLQQGMSIRCIIRMDH